MVGKVSGILKICTFSDFRVEIRTSERWLYRKHCAAFGLNGKQMALSFAREASTRKKGTVGPYQGPDKANWCFVL
jgi:hypothetical protein